jgi:hypothetical protein
MVRCGLRWRIVWVRAPYSAPLPGSRSPEGESVVAIFERHRDNLVTTLGSCGSGREMEERGHMNDKVLAGQLDVSDCVARFDGVAFVAT